MGPPGSQGIAGDDATSHKATRQQRRLWESRREREFYSFYDSLLTNASREPRFCDLHNKQEATAHTPRVSADTTLTAFTQLAALRLGVRRSMIFFFDADYAYVMAESTRTMSLRDNSQHDSGDALWLGFAKIPRGLSVCEVTADLPANQGSNARDPHTKSIAHIINNLAEDTRFCDLPYVQDGPKARFYAGVPITTPKGFNIGALCVLDDKPRDNLQPDQIDFLRSIAESIMSHLVLVRAKEDNQRSHDMTTALGAFVEGKKNARDWWHRPAEFKHVLPHAVPAPKTSRRPRLVNLGPGLPETPPTSTPAAVRPAEPTGYFSSLNMSEHTHLGLTDPVPAANSYQQPLPSPANSRPEASKSSMPFHPSRPPNPDTPHTSELELGDNNLPMQIKATVARAAGLIQTGVGADGVLFLDAALGTFGGLVYGSQGLSQTETDTDPDQQPAADAEIRTYRDNTARKAVVPDGGHPMDDAMESIVLGSAYHPDIAGHLKNSIQQARLSTNVLRSLLRRYPHGRIWHFDSDGYASDDDQATSESAGSFASAEDSAGSETDQQPTPSSVRAMNRTRARRKDARLIGELFPGIRSCMFLGMWNAQQERWFGASIVLSYCPTRIFSPQPELSFIAAFCDVVMGEVWRLEAHELGRSKNQFISSISHELRSPLHGILGCSESLEQSEQDGLKLELIRSINMCGTTLLEVVNDLLEYSGLNNDAQKRRKMSIAKATDSSPQGGTTVLLSTLTEDAVEAACLGFSHQASQQGPGDAGTLRQAAVVTLDVDLLDASDWLSSSNHGSWKRVCLNLVANALKYTHKGFINVSLRKSAITDLSGRPRKSALELVVKDSGIGMSDEFQAQSLFRPFQQEDKLTSGTGLGLNLVAQIVKSLNGAVHIQSTKNVGTTVKVTLPLRRSVMTAPTLAPPLQSCIDVGLVGFCDAAPNAPAESLDLESNRRLLQSLERCCQQIGGSVNVQDDFTDTNAVLFLVHPRELHRLCVDGVPRLWSTADSPMRPVIMICETREAALEMRASATAAHLPSRSQYLWLPIGPAKLAAAVSIILKPEALVSATDEIPSHDGNVSDDAAGTARPSVQIEDSKDCTRAVMAYSPEKPPRPGIDTHTRAEDPHTLSSEFSSPISPMSPMSPPQEGAFSLLLVEDNTINLKLLEVFAKKAGYKYATARNGREAVECYQDPATIKPDIILMDINMPVMDGFEATRRIRRYEDISKSERAAIIAVTGLGDTAAHEEAFQSGMDQFLTKPVKMRELKDIVARIRRNR